MWSGKCTAGQGRRGGGGVGGGMAVGYSLCVLEGRRTAGWLVVFFFFSKRGVNERVVEITEGVTCGNFFLFFCV